MLCHLSSDGLPILLSLLRPATLIPPFFFPSFLVLLLCLYFVPGYWPISILLNQFEWQLFTVFKRVIPRQETLPQKILCGFCSARGIQKRASDPVEWSERLLWVSCVGVGCCGPLQEQCTLNQAPSLQPLVLWRGSFAHVNLEFFIPKQSPSANQENFLRRVSDCVTLHISVGRVHLTCPRLPFNNF